MGQERGTVYVGRSRKVCNHYRCSPLEARNAERLHSFDLLQIVVKPADKAFIPFGAD